jgi:alpha-ribazole phosphatase
MKITLIRHTSLNINPGICYGQSDIAVSDNFEKEAKFALSKIQNRKFDAVFSSPLERCMKLARYCGFNDMILDNRLMEMNFGNWECKYWDKIEDPQLDKWFDNWKEVKPTNGESLIEFTARVESFILEIKDKNFNQVLLFTHAGVIRALITVLEIIDIDKAFEMKIDYGQVIELNI